MCFSTTSPTDRIPSHRAPLLVRMPGCKQKDSALLLDILLQPVSWMRSSAIVPKMGVECLIATGITWLKRQGFVVLSVLWIGFQAMCLFVAVLGLLNFSGINSSQTCQPTISKPWRVQNIEPDECIGVRLGVRLHCVQLRPSQNMTANVQKHTRPEVDAQHCRS